MHDSPFPRKTQTLSLFSLPLQIHTRLHANGCREATRRKMKINFSVMWICHSSSSSHPFVYIFLCLTHKLSCATHVKHVLCMWQWCERSHRSRPRRPDNGMRKWRCIWGGFTLSPSLTWSWHFHAISELEWITYQKMLNYVWVIHHRDRVEGTLTATEKNDKKNLLSMEILQFFSLLPATHIYFHILDMIWQQREELSWKKVLAVFLLSFVCAMFMIMLLTLPRGKKERTHYEAKK